MMFHLTASRSTFQVLLQTLASKRRIRDLAEQFDRMTNRVRVAPTQETVDVLVKTYGDMHLFGRLGRLLAYLASRADYKPTEEMQPYVLRSLVSQGSLNDAEQLYTQLMTSCSEEARAPITVAFAQALFEAGHINKAAEALRLVLPISPSSPVAQAANILKLKLALLTAMESEPNKGIGKKLMQTFEEQVANDVFVGNVTMDAQLYAAMIDGWRLAGNPAAALATIAKVLRVTNNEGFHRSDYINACMTLYNSIGKYGESVKLWKHCVARGHYAPSLQVCITYIESARCWDPQLLLEVANFLDERGYTTELALWKVSSEETSSVAFAWPLTNSLCFCSMNMAGTYQSFRGIAYHPSGSRKRAAGVSS
jgi:tetratricopeptide (TPR) repeat protein